MESPNVSSSPISSLAIKSTPFFNEAWAKGRSPKKGKGPLQRFLDWFLK